MRLTPIGTGSVRASARSMQLQADSTLIGSVVVLLDRFKVNGNILAVDFESPDENLEL